MHSENFPNIREIINELTERKLDILHTKNKCTVLEVIRHLYSDRKENLSSSFVAFFNEFDNILSNLQPIKIEQIPNVAKQIQEYTHKKDNSIEFAVINDLISISVSFLENIPKEIERRYKGQNVSEKELSIMVLNLKVALSFYFDCMTERLETRKTLVEARKDCIIYSVYVAVYDLFCN